MNATPETPYSIALTHNEVVALVKYHASQMRAVPKRLGKAMVSAGHPVAGWAAKKATRDATELIRSHQQRARDLLQVIGELSKKG